MGEDAYSNAFTFGQQVVVENWPSGSNRAVVTSNENAPFCYLVEYAGKAYPVDEKLLTAVRDSSPVASDTSTTSTMCAQRVCEGETSGGLASGSDAGSSGSSAAAEEAAVHVHRFALGQRVHVTAWSGRYEDAVCTVANVENAPYSYVISCDGRMFHFAEEQLYAAEESATPAPVVNTEANVQAPVQDESMGDAEVEDASRASVNCPEPPLIAVGQEVEVKSWPSGQNRAVVTSNGNAPYSYVVRYGGTTYPVRGDELVEVGDTLPVKEAEENLCVRESSAATEEAQDDSESDNTGGKSNSSEAPAFAVGQAVEVKNWPSGQNRGVVTHNENAPFCYLVEYKGRKYPVAEKQLAFAVDQEEGKKRPLGAPPTTPKRARYERSETSSSESDSEPSRGTCGKASKVKPASNGERRAAKQSLSKAQGQLVSRVATVAAQWRKQSRDIAVLAQEANAAAKAAKKQQGIAKRKQQDLQKLIATFHNELSRYCS